MNLLERIAADLDALTEAIARSEYVSPAEAERRANDTWEELQQYAVQWNARSDAGRARIAGQSTTTDRR